MMSEYHFGLGSGHLPKRADAIARRYDAWLVNYTEPDGRKRHWFACANLGAPFDVSRAQRVLDALDKAGL